MIETSIASWDLDVPDGFPNVNKHMETLLCYGVVVGVACPTVLKLIMDFEDGSARFVFIRWDVITGLNLIIWR